MSSGLLAAGSRRSSATTIEPDYVIEPSFSHRRPPRRFADPTAGPLPASRVGCCKRPAGSGGSRANGSSERP